MYQRGLRTDVPTDDEELTVHATELIPESNESSSPSVLPADAKKLLKRKTFMEPVDERGARGGG